jgi:hypothetical protein
MNTSRAFGVLFVALTLSVCSAPTPARSIATPAVVSSPTVSARPSGWPEGDALPPALAGTWFKEIPSGNVNVMILAGYTYTLPESGGAGNIVVNGNEIDVFNGGGCGAYLPEGIGRYSWSLSGASLHLVALAPDPCGRALAGPSTTPAVSGLTWTRTKP